MKSKWVTVLLVTSLGLNLALAGYLLGSRGLLPAAGIDPTRSYPRWVRTLPEERRNVLRPIVRQQRQEIRPALRALRQQHQALRHAITAQPFNPEVLVTALINIRGEHAQVQQLSHTSFAKFVEQLTDLERQQLAEDMKRPPRGLRPGGPSATYPRHNRSPTPTIEKP